MQTQVLPLSPTSFTFTPPAKTIDITISPTYSRDLKHLAIIKEQLLAQENVVALPTETVYGLAAIAAKEEAVRKVFEAKKRPNDNPLIVHVSGIEMLKTIALWGPREISIYGDMIDRHWPGPLTILLPHIPGKLAPSVTAGHDTVAVRFPSNNILRAVLNVVNQPLAAPSANLSGKPSPTTAQHVQQDLNDRIPLIIDGGSCDWGVESTVVDGLRNPPVILRPGGVSNTEIAKCAGWSDCIVYNKNQEGGSELRPRAPGMKYRHYAPSGQIHIVDLLKKPNQEKWTLPAQLAAKEAQRKATEATLAKFVAAASIDNPIAIGVMLSRKLERKTNNQRFTIHLSSEDCKVPFSLDSYLYGESAATDCKSPDPIALTLEFMVLHGSHVVFAQSLFSVLRYFDDCKCSDIIVEACVEDGVGLAAMERLRRAAAK